MWSTPQGKTRHYEPYVYRDLPMWVGNCADQNRGVDHMDRSNGIQGPRATRGGLFRTMSIDEKFEEVVRSAWFIAGNASLRVAGMPLETFKLILAVGGIIKFFEDTDIEDLIVEQAEYLFEKYRTGIPEREM